jgi:hypothetical protein
MYFKDIGTIPIKRRGVSLAFKNLYLRTKATKATKGGSVYGGQVV